VVLKGVLLGYGTERKAFLLAMVLRERDVLLASGTERRTFFMALVLREKRSSWLTY